MKGAAVFQRKNKPGYQARIPVPKQYRQFEGGRPQKVLGLKTTDKAEARKRATMAEAKLLGEWEAKLRAEQRGIKKTGPDLQGLTLSERLIELARWATDYSPDPLLYAQLLKRTFQADSGMSKEDLETLTFAAEDEFDRALVAAGEIDPFDPRQYSYTLPGLPMSTLVEKYCQRREVTKLKRDRPQTIHTYLMDFAEYMNNAPVSSVTPQDAHRYFVHLSESEVAQGTASNRKAVLQKAWKFWTVAGDAPRNVWGEIDVSSYTWRDTVLRRAFTKPELQAMMTLPDKLEWRFKDQQQVCRDFLEMAFYLGARSSEVTALRKTDVVQTSIDGKYRLLVQISDGKTDSATRDIPVPLALDPVIRRLVSDSQDGYLLKLNDKTRRGHSLSVKLSTGMDKIGLNDPAITAAHSFRRLWATIGLQSNDKESRVADYLFGHVQEGGRSRRLREDLYADNEFSDPQKFEAVDAMDFDSWRYGEDTTLRRRLVDL
tara:strand:+ start:507 stop:1967 length:1461 start_codon:yes stop_codon:yes gene_type:complete